MHALASFVLLLGLAACSPGDANESHEQQDPAGQEAEKLDWQQGTDGTLVHRSDDEILRCWKLQDGYDCLYADVFDIRSEIADSRVSRNYYRFVSEKLPTRRAELERLNTANGYACLVSEMGNGTSYNESVWQDGKVIAEATHVSHDQSSVPWTSEDVMSVFDKNRIQARRPFFRCPLLNDVVARSDLSALDSPLVMYDSIMWTEQHSGSDASQDPELNGQEELL